MKVIKPCHRPAHHWFALMLATAMVTPAYAASDRSGANTATAEQHKTIDWTDLIPEDDLEALMNPPDYVTELEDDSVEDQLSGKLQNALAAASDDRYQEALVSTRIRPELNGHAVRIAGFVVPLAFNDVQRVSQFFLVPYFGACIHLPPPPPNQIVWINYPQGLALPDLYQPFWISGVLSTAITENTEATAAYAMTLQRYELYDEPYEE